MSLFNWSLATFLCYCDHTSGIIRLLFGEPQLSLLQLRLGQYHPLHCPMDSFYMPSSAGKSVMDHWHHTLSNPPSGQLVNGRTEFHVLVHLPYSVKTQLPGMPLLFTVFPSFHPHLPLLVTPCPLTASNYSGLPSPTHSDLGTLEPNLTGTQISLN